MEDVLVGCIFQPPRRRLLWSLSPMPHTRLTGRRARCKGCDFHSAGRAQLGSWDRRLVSRSPFEQEVRVGAADLTEAHAAIQVGRSIREMSAESDRNSACAGMFDHGVEHG